MKKGSPHATSSFSKVISFAEKIGLWDGSRKKEEFSFADAYDPITFTGARLSDARVWSFLSRVAADRSFEKTYENYVLGHNVSAAARMPLSIEAGVKISALDLMSYMRNHYAPWIPLHEVTAAPCGMRAACIVAQEGMALDSRSDVGAGRLSLAWV